MSTSNRGEGPGGHSSGGGPGDRSPGSPHGAGGRSGGSGAGNIRLPGGAAAVFLASALVLSLQIALIRALSVDTYHHFTYLVISTALLGFGASGTLLTILWRHIERRFMLWSAVALLALVVSAAYGYRVAVLLRPDMQYVLYSWAEVFKLWAHTLVLFLPFFAGGAFVGMALAWFRAKTGLVYGANMVGSGLGGVSGVLLAFVVAPYRMPVVLSVLGVGALAAWVSAWPRAYRRGPVARQAVLLPIVGAAAVVIGLLAPFSSSVDQYKPMAHALRLAEQGDAKHIRRTSGPRAQIDVFDVPSMHHTLFAKPTAPAPPAQSSLFLDAAHAGGIFRIDGAEEAGVLRHVAQALAYRVTERPRVLILGEQTGVNVWMALAHGAREVTVVQANPQLIETIRKVRGPNGSVFDHPAVRVVQAEPRLFLERGAGVSGREPYDIIHVAEAEGMPAGSGGLASMREDYLLTMEAMDAALARLSEQGVITVTRGMQSPPRDNVRMFALFEAAVRQSAGRPQAAAKRLLQARNYLAVTTIASAEPLAGRRLERFREAAAELSMDVDYFPGIEPEDLTERNRVPGPEGETGSYYYHAAGRILAGESEREAFFNDWVYNVRPPTDSRPYFHSFFRWDSLERYVQSYGQFWFQRMELGYAVVFVTFLQVLVAALVLVLAPVLFLRRRRAGRGVPWTVLHFTAIGLGFLLIEMLHIQRFTRFLGDPIYSTAAVLTAILVFSGVGSYLQGRFARGEAAGSPASASGLSAASRIRIGGAAVALLAVLYYLGLDPVLSLVVEAGETLRFLITLVLLFPLSFMMGWLMPAGLEAAGKTSQELVPLAWAVNGVASVAATPLSVMVAAGGGFLSVTLLAVGCYGAVAAAAPWSSSN